MAPPLPNSAHGDLVISAKPRGTARFLSDLHMCRGARTLLPPTRHRSNKSDRNVRRNHAVHRSFGATFLCDATETDWLAGAADSNLGIPESKFAKTPAWGCGIRTSAS